MTTTESTGGRAAHTRRTSSPKRAGVAAAALAAATALVTGAASGRTQDVTPMTDAVKAQLAPNGRLRAGLNYGNFLLVTTRAPEHTGVAPDLARELARRAGATVEFVGYTNAGLVADAAKDQAWDVAFIGAEPARASMITFTPAYVEIDATYVVPEGSPLRTAADVDRPGIRIASGARAAYTLFLQRALTQATVTEVTGEALSPAGFAKAGYDALADLKPRLTDVVTKTPGLRIVDGRFTAVQQSMAAPKAHAEAAAYLTAFAEEIKRTGLLASLIEKYRAHGLSIAR